MKTLISKKSMMMGLVSIAWLIATSALADDNTGFRCERARDIKLAELKAKLVENCDLSKPFSFSQEPSIQTVFIYCCNAKKQ